MDKFEKFQDKILICVDCKEEFVFTTKAQEYFAEHGFTEEPKRCRNCYAQYKHEISMRHIKRSREDAGYDFREPNDGLDDDGNDGGSTYVWQPRPFPPPPRQDHDRCGFGDDERWAK